MDNLLGELNFGAFRNRTVLPPLLGNNLFSEKTELDLAEHRQQMAHRNEEIFQRMKVDTFVTLVLQTAKADVEKDLLLQTADSQHKDDSRLGVDDLPNMEQSRTDLASSGFGMTDRSSFQSVICGLGESDFSRQKILNQSLTSSRITVDDSKPYLLLDVRDDDHFRLGHIISSFHYPTHWLARATHFESAEMLAYKNRPGKVVIICDDNEKTAPTVASTLVQRGYDNIHLMSGGLKIAFQKYPQGLITGTIPAEFIETEKPKKGKGKKGERSVSLPPAKNSVLKSCFEADDLELLRQQLQYNLLPKASRSRLVKDTSAAKIRNDTIRNQQKHQTRQVPWH